ncbi:MAG TPA: C1 family peptidase [Nocardioides sp.]|uniref:C1 family peptidase n=1 Tax=uncultured Nocardioides sp. TaxID=198441 RepID=UPI002612C6A9|nr:C1 family peptidase [uncultured Nocardioides sp.]HRI97174.1 C1 family peptidase [Nocardioides sp.]HRK46875.1 C1 family peptidase [Nocardioides sp.]
MSRTHTRVVPLVLTAILAISVAAPTPAEAKPGGRPVHDRISTPITADPGTAPGRQVATLPLGDATRAQLRAQRTLKAKLKVSARVEVGSAATFKTKGSKATRGLRSIKLSFGDGAKTRGHKLTLTRKHSYAKPGIYLAKLVVKDQTGKKAVAKKNVQVVDRAAPPNGFGALPPDPAQDVAANPDAAPGAGAGSPASVDLRGSTVPVQNQGQVNSCVSWTTAYAMMGWYYRQKYGQSAAFAPMYVYSQTYKGLDAYGNPNGSYATDALNVLKTQGVDTASHYGAGWAMTWNVQPNASQRANAANYRISGSDTIFRYSGSLGGATVGTTATDIEALKQRLASNNPVAIAFRVRTDFAGYNTGWYNGSGALTGGLHEMLAVGYDATGLYIQNSWGTGHGVSGYVYMTWAAVQRDLYEAMFAHGLVTSGGGGGGDAVKPTITSFSKQFGVGYIANNAQAPMTFTWGGTDNVGVTKYVLYYRTGASDWYELAIADNATSATYNLAFNNSYEFAVAAYDAAGNLSNWALSGLFTPANYQESVASYTAGWTAYDSANYMNGRLYETGTANAYMQVQVTATNFGLVSTKGSGAGRAYVYLDGAYQFTIDAYDASTSYRHVVAWMNFGSSSTHTIRVVNEGTSGRPYFDIDSILLS